MEEFAEWVRCMAVRAFPSLGRAGVELYSVEFFLKELGNKRTSLAGFGQGPRLNRKGSWLGKEF